jgi:succinate dehydrogenase hydrophobic anchor subunit
MKTPENSWLWLYKIVAGLLVVTLLAVHFVINHAVAPEGLLSYADVVRYYQVPGVALMEVAFLVFVISHALVGLRSIILDLNPTPRLLRMVNIALLLIGSGAILFGIWLVLVIQSRG